MKVTGVRTFIVQPPQGKTALFVKVETDEGLYGWGEVYTVTNPRSKTTTYAIDSYP